jgi:hypothetical protein
LGAILTYKLKYRTNFWQYSTLTHTAEMAHHMLGACSSELTTTLVHFIALLRSSVLTGSVLYNFVTLPLPEVQKKLSEMNVILCVLLGSISFSLLCLRSRILGKSSALEKASAIILMGVWTVSFVDSEFHDRKWWRLCYLALLGTCTTKILSLFLDCRTGTFFNFPAACVGYGMVILIPVAHAKLSPLAHHTPLASTFIELVGVNILGGLIYAFQVPERLGKLVSSRLVLHCIVVYSATLLSDKLLTSYTSGYV